MKVDISVRWLKFVMRKQTRSFVLAIIEIELFKNRFYLFLYCLCNKLVRFFYIHLKQVESCSFIILTVLLSLQLYLINKKHKTYVTFIRFWKLKLRTNEITILNASRNYSIAIVLKLVSLVNSYITNHVDFSSGMWIHD